MNRPLNCPPLPATAIPFFKTATPIELPEGTVLFKFTGHTLFGNGLTTPWWALYDPSPRQNDGGLPGVLKAAKSSGKPLSQFVRHFYSVMLNWNTMSGPGNIFVRIQKAKLVRTVSAYHGPCAPVPEVRAWSTDPRPDVQYAGGACQIYVNEPAGALIGAGITLMPD